MANTLVLEPAGSDIGEEACFELLTVDPPSRENVLVVSFSWSPDRWLETWDRRTGDERPAGVGFIAVGEQRRAAEAHSGASHPRPGAFTVLPVPHPGNLTDIGVALTELLSMWAADDNRVVICLRSLTPMLMHTDLRSTYRFLHIMTGQVQTSGATGHYHLDPGTCDERTLCTLKTLFNAVVVLDDDGEWLLRQE